MSEDKWIIGVVPTYAGDLFPTPSDESLLQQLVNLGGTGGGGGGGGSLPAGASTSANQVTANASLAAIQTEVTKPVVGAASFATTSVTGLGTPSSLIIAARTGAAGTGRVSVTITNIGTVAVFLVSASGVSTGGVSLPVGSSRTITTTAAIYGYAPTGSGSVDVMETF